jgi:hypothetical protein
MMISRRTSVVMDVSVLNVCADTPVGYHVRSCVLVPFVAILRCVCAYRVAVLSSCRSVGATAPGRLTPRGDAASIEYSRPVCHMCFVTLHR